MQIGVTSQDDLLSQLLFIFFRGGDFQNIGNTQEFLWPLIVQSSKIKYSDGLFSVLLRKSVIRPTGMPSRMGLELWTRFRPLSLR